MIREKEAQRSELFERLAGVFAGATSTAQVVDWQKLQLGDGDAALTRAKRIDLLLRAANSGRLKVDEINALAGSVLIRAPADKAAQLPDAEQERLRQNLSVLTDGSATDRKEFAADVAKHVERYCVIVPRFSVRGDRAERLVASTLAVGLDYGLLLLTEEPFSRLLHRCRYSRCRKFFLTPAVRGRPLKHCVPEHGRLADSEAAPERMKRVRKANRGRQQLW
jgi:hypothetical protein